MPSKGKIERWLLENWDGGRLLQSSSMIKVTEEVKVGVKERSRRINDVKDEAVSAGGNQPSKTRKSLKAIENTTPAVKADENNEERIYSPSGSSWAPSEEESSDTESEHSVAAEKVKPVKLTKQYGNSKRFKRGPVHRPDPVIPNASVPGHPKSYSNYGGAYKNNSHYGVTRQGNSNIEESNNDNRNYRVTRNDNSNHRLTRNSNISVYGVILNDSSAYGSHSTPKMKQDKSKNNYNSADSSGRNQIPVIQQRNLDIDFKKLLISSIKSDFLTIFKILDNLKPKYGNNNDATSHVTETDKSNDIPQEEECNSESEESHRSDDNVLISNKYNSVLKNLPSNANQNNDCEEEWVPIGSGKTMIHKNKFRKVNWKSYTIATRTLLLAAFPRRILATHSLTGKRSPAFQNKPAKMCLDPKIVADIILEITSKFKVKENFVRTIITTKCADECKMYKLRIKNKKKPLHNDENTA